MTDRKGVVIVGELLDERLTPVTAELLGIGRKLANDLGHELAAVLIGFGVGKAAGEAIFAGADKVYVIDNPLFKDYLTDSYVGALDRLDKQLKPEVLLLGHTSLGRDLAPRLAFRLGTGITQDCIELSIDPGTKLLQKTKPVYGGKALAVYVCREGRPQMATVRLKAMEPLAYDTSRKGGILPFDPELDEAAVRGRLTGREKDEIIGVKLEEANVVICGGRGIGDPESFQQLEELARMLGGAVGATRPPCDNKWCPAHYQIGLTGKLVSPLLYIGVALSGASQHLAGMSGSKIIVAINKDPEANIFKLARFGVVANWKEVLPSFGGKIKELSARANSKE